MKYPFGLLSFVWLGFDPLGQHRKKHKHSPKIQALKLLR